MWLTWRIGIALQGNDLQNLENQFSLKKGRVCSSTQHQKSACPYKQADISDNPSGSGREWEGWQQGQKIEGQRKGWQTKKLKKEGGNDESRRRAGQGGRSFIGGTWHRLWGLEEWQVDICTVWWQRRRPPLLDIQHQEAQGQASWAHNLSSGTCSHTFFFRYQEGLEYESLGFFPWFLHDPPGRSRNQIHQKPSQSLQAPQVQGTLPRRSPPRWVPPPVWFRSRRRDTADRCPGIGNEGRDQNGKRDDDDDDDDALVTSSTRYIHVGSFKKCHEDL